MASRTIKLKFAIPEQGSRDYKQWFDECQQYSCEALDECLQHQVRIDEGIYEGDTFAEIKDAVKSLGSLVFWAGKMTINSLYSGARRELTGKRADVQTWSDFGNFINECAIRVN